MRVLIAGGSGFVGRRLSELMKEKGFTLSLLTRGNVNLGCYDNMYYWDQLSGLCVSQFDIVINLCGYDISKKRWSNNVKEKIKNSRIQTTNRLLEFIDGKDIRFICASAIGIYPFSHKAQDEFNNFDDENSHGFCQDLVRSIEQNIIRSNADRYILLRIGVVVGSLGFMKKMLPSAYLGMGALFGRGDQLLSWIHIDDLCSAILNIIEIKRFNNEAINLTAPNACTQKEFIDTLCRNIKRPRFFVIPKVIINLIFGEMGKELILSSHNIIPTKLLANSYHFRYPKIEDAIKSIIKKGKDNERV